MCRPKGEVKVALAHSVNEVLSQLQQLTEVSCQIQATSAVVLSLIFYVHSAGRTALQLRSLPQSPFGQCIISGLWSKAERNMSECHRRIVTEGRIQVEASWPQEGTQTQSF